jgi:hypothetical protein
MIAGVCAILSTLVLLPGGWKLEPISGSISVDLAPFWDGRLEIQELRLELPDSISANGVMITDQFNRPWAVVDEIRGFFRGGGFKDGRIEVERPQLFIYFRDGRLDCNLPQSRGRDPQQAEWLAYLAKFEPEFLNIKDLAVTVVAGPNETSIRGIQAVVFKADNANYKLKAWLDPNETRPQDQYQGVLEGYADSVTKQIDYDFKGKIIAALEPSSVMFKAIGVNQIQGLEAAVELENNTDGCADDYLSLLPRGHGRITEGKVYGRQGLLCDTFAANIEFAKRELHIENVHATGLGGVVVGDFWYALPPEGKGSYGGFARVRDVDWPTAAHRLGMEKSRTGRISVTMRFAQRGGDPNSLTGKAAVLIDDADLGNIRLLSRLVSVLNLADPLQFSDAVGYFEMQGQVLDFKVARVSSRLAAVEFEKDLMVNWQTGYVRGHAVVLAFPGVKRMLLGVPILGRIVNLHRIVSRFKVEGRPAQPGKLIYKEPLKDIGRATVDFFTGAVRSQGHIPHGVFENLEMLPEGK